MSKMTVPNENDNGSDYENLKFVEFLEMISRAAHYKYEGTP